MKKIKIIKVSFVLFGLLTLVGVSWAETDYPVKPITFLCPWSPGGIGDTVARLFAESARKYLPQPLIVVNRPGASGTTAMAELVKSKPDGYTLAEGGTGEGASTLHIVSADYGIDSYTIICRIGVCLPGLVTTGPWNTLKELIDYAKQNPDKIRAGHPGMGTFARIAGVQLATQAGFKWREVPFPGEGPIVPAVLGGHVEVGLINVGGFISQYKGGQLKALCVFGEQRCEVTPEVPTSKELGYKISGGNIHFVVAPNGLPQAIREKLEVQMKKAVEDPEFQKRSVDIGYNASYADAAASKAFMKEWYKTSGELFEKLGITKKK